MKEGKQNPLGRLARFVLRLSWMLCVPAGVLWALSPLGVYLSEYMFKTPNVFWKLFPSAPLLMLVGLAGLYFCFVRQPGWPERVGFYGAVLGISLVVAGDVGKFYLGLDDAYIMTAPAYRTLRLGLILLTAGAMVFGVAAARAERLPVWGALPFAIGSLAGLISVARDLGSPGAALWISFGVAWVWLGLAVLVDRVRQFLRKRRSIEPGGNTGANVI